MNSEYCSVCGIKEGYYSKNGKNLIVSIDKDKRCILHRINYFFFKVGV